MKRQSTVATTPSNSRAPRVQPPAQVKPPTKAPKPSVPTNKLDLLVDLMRAKAGATIDQLTKATGWQKHSVRGAISGALKKNGGFKVISERIDGVRVYRIAK